MVQITTAYADHLRSAIPTKTIHMVKPHANLRNVAIVNIAADVILFGNQTSIDTNKLEQTVPFRVKSQDVFVGKRVLLFGGCSKIACIVFAKSPAHILVLGSTSMKTLVTVVQRLSKAFTPFVKFHSGIQNHHQEDDNVTVDDHPGRRKRRRRKRIRTNTKGGNTLVGTDQECQPKQKKKRKKQRSFKLAQTQPIYQNLTKSGSSSISSSSKCQQNTLLNMWKTVK